MRQIKLTKRAVFIGRWTPFHNGHLTIMKKKIEEGKPLLILVRDTHYDLYPAEMRKRMIEAAMSELKVDAKVEIIDDIESVNYGRGVGYEINEIEVPENIKRVSATQIREMISDGDKSWREFIPSGADKVLEDYLSDKGMVVWFTGLPKAGKSTIANLVSYKLERQGIRNERLDSKILRESISSDLMFTKEDRDKNLERAAFIAKILSRNGGIALCSFITPYEKQREEIKKEVNSKARFVEVYVKCSLEECKRRDNEGLYEKAEKGEIKNFTGVSDPYEEPKNPNLVLDTEKKSAEESANEVVKYILSLVK